ncbi:MAG: hypothetical protein CSA20_05390 [Deltaproteobacteria bacterium]|nr:MAG: hypothetical protein CSA20_05390 [Deltaproteobacteria bacterium]
MAGKKMIINGGCGHYITRMVEWQEGCLLKTVCFCRETSEKLTRNPLSTTWAEGLVLFFPGVVAVQTPLW